MRGWEHAHTSTLILVLLLHLSCIQEQQVNSGQLGEKLANQRQLMQLEGEVRQAPSAAAFVCAYIERACVPTLARLVERSPLTPEHVANNQDSCAHFGPKPSQFKQQLQHSKESAAKREHVGPAQCAYSRTGCSWFSPGMWKRLAFYLGLTSVPGLKPACVHLRA